MKLLKIVANNFKLCKENITISFVPVANKTKEDREFELHEIADSLFVYSTMGIIGKNASGKTTVVDLLALVYDIFSFFKVKNTFEKIESWDKTINIDVTFFHEGYLYRYITDIYLDKNSITKTALFKNQELFKREYYKSYSNRLFEFDKYEKVKIDESLPADTSILYRLLNDINLRGLYCSSDDERENVYAASFNIYKMINKNSKVIEAILKMFDEHLENIEMINEDKFIVKYINKKNVEVSSKELYRILSSGTTKGFGLFTFVVYSLQNGLDLIIDEIENHFHKTLVENLVNLYKDKSVNKNSASLIFTTHYCELLDLFNRTDNIYITKYKEKITLENMYIDYEFRPELSKSKKFYQNAFDTGVNYENLMSFKKELM